MDHEQFTQEIRLSATLFDGYADLTVGGFYLDQETNEDGRINANYIGFDFVHGPDLVPSTSKALYGQLSLNLSERWELALGLRYSEDEKSYTFQRHNPDGTLPGAPVAGPFFFAGNPANGGVFGLNMTSLSYSSDQLDYRVALDYDISEDVMVYGQVATGYRAGGNNARPFYPSQLHAFNPEELTNYEVGMKSTLFDQLRLNASVFFNDYTDIQLNVVECYWAPEFERAPCGSLDNIGDAEVKGFELEGMWRPTEAFSLDFSYALVDFQFTELSPLAGVDINSNTPYTPDSAWSLGAQYRFKLGDGLGDVTPRIDVSYQDDIISGAVASDFNKIEAYTLVNGRVAWRSDDLKWEVGLEVTNLTDEYYYLTIFDIYDLAGFANAQPARPREWAFTIKRIWF